MRRNYARSPKGQPAYSREAYRPEGIPASQGAGVNLLACMSLEGMVFSSSKGAASTPKPFATTEGHILCPQLRPRQILVLDNYPVHKTAIVAEHLEQHGCKLFFLSTYSPDFNPIELLFAKLKQQLRLVPASSLDALSLAIHNALKQMTLSDLIGWFKHAGYIVY